MSDWYVKCPRCSAIMWPSITDDNAWWCPIDDTQYEAENGQLRTVYNGRWYGGSDEVWKLSDLQTHSVG
jgi:hypothetical protein